MKPGATMVKTARSGLVDDAADSLLGGIGSLFIGGANLALLLAWQP